MKITLDWLGVATFRLVIGDLTLFLDAYMERVPAAPPVGLRPADIPAADFVLVGHSHFDHIAGAEVIAANTGARVIGSHESCRVLEERGVARAQLLPSQGGEHHRLGDGVSVRVFPGLHSCTWVTGTTALDEEWYGHLGLCEDERAQQRGLTSEIVAAMRSGAPEGDALRQHVAAAAGSLYPGGPLAYLIETPELNIFWQDTSGCWSGVLRGLRPDVAILAAAGRGNLDGEPYQGSLAQFVADEAAMLQAKRVIICHHDDWMPPVTRDTTDVGAIHAELAKRAPDTELVEMGYLAGVRL